MKNKYDRKSDHVFHKICPNCGKDNALLESFAHYLKEYLFMTPGAIVTCQHCKKGEIKV